MSRRPTLYTRRLAGNPEALRPLRTAGVVGGGPPERSIASSPPARVSGSPPYLSGTDGGAARSLVGGVEAANGP